MNDTLPGSDGIPTPDHSGAEEIPYYQWVPIILAFMIFTFAIPGLSPTDIKITSRILMLSMVLYPGKLGHSGSCV